MKYTGFNAFDIISDMKKGGLVLAQCDGIDTIRFSNLCGCVHSTNIEVHTGDNEPSRLAMCKLGCNPTIDCGKKKRRPKPDKYEPDLTEGS
jgi:hypothetical protein